MRTDAAMKYKMNAAVLAQLGGSTSISNDNSLDIACPLTATACTRSRYGAGGSFVRWAVWDGRNDVHSLSSPSSRYMYDVDLEVTKFKAAKSKEIVDSSCLSLIFLMYVTAVSAARLPRPTLRSLCSI